VDGIGGNRDLDWFQPRGGPPTMGENETLAFPDTAEDAFRVLAELQHGFSPARRIDRLQTELASGNGLGYLSES
jgi:hypothetical protein